MNSWNPSVKKNKYMAGKTKVRPKNTKMHKDWKVTISGLVAVLLYLGNTGSDLEMFSSDCSMLMCRFKTYLFCWSLLTDFRRIRNMNRPIPMRRMIRGMLKTNIHKL